MIIEIQHETRLSYSEPVTEAITEVRMEPTSDADQSCRSFRLTVSPATETFRYQDGFGNRAHHFNLLAPHDEVRVLAASVVETHPAPRDLGGSRVAWPCEYGPCDLEVMDYLKFRGPVRSTSLLGPVLEALRPRPGQRLVDLVVAVSRYIHGGFEYAPAVTLASSPIDDVLTAGKGVCQDFTHLMIAVLRAFGVPARYVSGYIHRPGRESQSHAWCEAWVPDVGWLGVDPTNDKVVDDHFVKVALGRDFTDVPPNRGVYRGKGMESIEVRVETRTLGALPSLSWAEQLPPLHVPMTVILGPTRHDLGRDADEWLPQQQQQQ